MLSVDFVILDFDGVLTDNRVYVFEDGREAVACNRADGWGIRQLRGAKIEVKEGTIIKKEEDVADDF